MTAGERIKSADTQEAMTGERVTRQRATETRTKPMTEHHRDMQAHGAGLRPRPHDEAQNGLKGRQKTPGKNAEGSKRVKGVAAHQSSGLG